MNELIDTVSALTAERDSLVRQRDFARALVATHRDASRDLLGENKRLRAKLTMLVEATDAARNKNWLDVPTLRVFLDALEDARV